jgi:sugar-phosphatase
MRVLEPGTWAVVTSALAAPAARRIAGAGLPVPDVLVGADNVSSGKPNPEGYLVAASALGIDPTDCVVIEDTAAGLQAGREAGAHTIAVGNLAGADAAVSRRVVDFRDLRVSVTNGRILIESAD